MRKDQVTPVYSISSVSSRCRRQSVTRHMLRTEKLSPGTALATHRALHRALAQGGQPPSPAGRVPAAARGSSCLPASAAGGNQTGIWPYLPLSAGRAACSPGLPGTGQDLSFQQPGFAQPKFLPLSARLPRDREWMQDPDLLMFTNLPT